jgi:hypothetical protein
MSIAFPLCLSGSCSLFLSHTLIHGRWNEDKKSEPIPAAEAHAVAFRRFNRIGLTAEITPMLNRTGLLVSGLVFFVFVFVCLLLLLSGIRVRSSSCLDCIGFVWSGRPVRCVELLFNSAIL